ncbi:M15 family metallopeptidase [Allokutzneria multivorans]|uniref:M15 family metallopeptidase n=1 Tax=Allokutzneria multivorans TaxID=1142134 RepID=UPI0031E8BDDF
MTTRPVVLGTLVLAGVLVACADTPPPPAPPAPVTSTAAATTTTTPANTGPLVSVQDVDPSIVVEARYFTDHNFVGERIDGYEANKCLVTPQAAEGLRRVQEELRPKSLSLKVYDCYRPQRAVNHFVRWAKTSDTRMKAEFYPTLGKDRLFPDGYIAERSGHSRGSTVDLTLIDVPARPQAQYRAGEGLANCTAPQERRFADNSVDMGTGFDCFDKLAHTANPAIAQPAKGNRALLKSLMDKHGFTNYAQEWWHFTLRGEPHPGTYFDLPVR